jgi:carboxylesterase
VDIGIAGLAVLAIVARAIYPRLLERRQARRRPTGPDGIIMGAEEITKERASAPAILVLHGGGDTPQAMLEMADALYQRGFAVRVPLLADHGRCLAAMRAFDASKWRQQVRREFETLRADHDWVGVVGLSVGGALALDLAAERDDVGALVLLAPFVAASRTVRVLARTSRWWGALLPYLPSRGGRSIHDSVAAARGLAHGLVTPAELRSLADVANLARDALPRTKSPTLMIQSREDNRVSPAAAEEAFAKLGAPDKRFVWTEGAGHVITVDYGKNRVFEHTTEWMQTHVQPATLLTAVRGPTIPRPT